ncbi:unnamed protein product [Caenorhabditis brenneri]
MNIDEPPISGAGEHLIFPNPDDQLFSDQRPRVILTDEELAQNYGPIQSFDENLPNGHAEEAVDDDINQQPEVRQEYNMEHDLDFEDHQAEHRHEMEEHLNPVEVNGHAEEAVDDVINQQPEVRQEYNMEHDFDFEGHRVEHRHEMEEQLNQVEVNGFERASQGRAEDVPNGEARDLQPVENGNNANRAPEIKQEVRDNELENDAVQNVNREIKIEPNQDADNDHAEHHHQDMGEQHNHSRVIDNERVQEGNQIDLNGEDMNLQPAETFNIHGVAVEIWPKPAWKVSDCPEDIAQAEAKPLATTDEVEPFLREIHEGMNRGELLVNRRFIALLRSKKFDEVALVKIYKLLFWTANVIQERIEQVKLFNDEDSLSALKGACLIILDSYTSVTVTCINDELRDSYRKFIMVLDTITRNKVIEAKYEASTSEGGNEGNGEPSTSNRVNQGSSENSTEMNKRNETFKKYADEVARKFRSVVWDSSYSEMCCFYLVYRHLQEINDTYEDDVDVFDHLPLLQKFDDMDARFIHLRTLFSYNYVYCRKLEACATDAKNSRRTEKYKKYEAFLICLLLDNEPIAASTWKALLRIYHTEIGKTARHLDPKSKADKELTCRTYDKLASDFKIFKGLKTDQINHIKNVNGKSYDIDFLYLSLIRIDIFRFRYNLTNDDAEPNNDRHEIITDGMNALCHVENYLEFPDYVKDAIARFEFVFDAGHPYTTNMFHHMLPKLPKATVVAVSKGKTNAFLSVLGKYKATQNQQPQPMIGDGGEPERNDEQGGVERMDDDFEYDNAVEDAPGVHPIRAVPNDPERPELIDPSMDEDTDMAPVADRATRNQNRNHRVAFNKTMEIYSVFAADRTFRFEVDAAPIQPNRLQNDDQDDHAMEVD